MKFKEVDFWCEFPNKLNWALTKKILKKYKLNSRIFIAVKTKKEFLNYKKKISLKLVPWVLLPKKEGYFFSGFSKKEDIKTLNQFRGMNIFIDVEPPFPAIRYSPFDFGMFYLYLIVHKAKNYPFLKKQIAELSKTNKIYVSEFPFPHFIFRKLGCYINPKKLKYNKNVIKVLGAYTTIFKEVKFIFRPFIFHEVKRKIQEDKNAFFAIGLTGHGITKSEDFYKDTEEFRSDLEKFYSLNAKNIIIYSLDTLIKRKDKEKFFELISKL